jgi:hypothetical protein
MEMTCKICGFVTNNYEDMCRHLAWTQKYKEENCNYKLISMNCKALKKIYDRDREVKELMLGIEIEINKLKKMLGILNRRNGV